jgi:hypothetical protein
MREKMYRDRKTLRRMKRDRKITVERRERNGIEKDRKNQ